MAWRPPFYTFIGFSNFLSKIEEIDFADCRQCCCLKRATPFHFWWMHLSSKGQVIDWTSTGQNPPCTSFKEGLLHGATRKPQDMPSCSAEKELWMRSPWFAGELGRLCFVVIFAQHVFCFLLIFRGFLCTASVPEVKLMVPEHGARHGSLNPVDMILDTG